LKKGISDFNQYLFHSVFNGIHLTSAPVILLAAGIIIFLGVLGEVFFRKTGIPGVSFLEGIGRVFASKKMQSIFLVMGAIVFSATTIVMFATMPIYPGNFSL
jgi:hypothetical protein